MMQPKFTFILLLILFSAVSAFSQTALQTSFETAQSYTAGNINGQNKWTVTSGTGVVSTAKFKTGAQSANLSATAAALLVNYTAYSGAVPGITGEVYADMWVNPANVATKNFSINGMDLWSGSSKRIFLIEFGTDGNIKAYSTSTATNVGIWTAGTWVRISVKMDFVAEKYKIAINGAVNATDFVFRDLPYAPTASGTRLAGKEFHSLRFNQSGDATIATSDIAFDDMYIGTTPISDVPFSGSTIRTVTVTQPAFGSIALSPAAPYNIGQTVTATLTVPQGYINNGWTGDLSGTSLVQNFTIADNMSIGANVGIDAANPPPKYLVTVTQPANGTITLSPASADNMYYKETPVTATVSFDACYQLTGWTGGLSGTALSQSFTIQNDIAIGANLGVSTIPSVKRSVANAVDFKAALAAMNPGDTVEVADGTYDLSSLTISRTGCDLRPVVIMAKNKGQVILNGATSLVLKNLKYVTLTGFVFKSTGIASGIKLENCNRVRVSGNSFNYTEAASCTWITIGDTFGSTLALKSGNNKIDHNLFDGKTQTGNYIRMDGNIDQQSRNDTIEYNYFKNNGPRADNEKESIRVGVSTLSHSSGFTVIQYNLFEDCDGDPEVVSIKSCDNTVRYNTFLHCLGTLCLRQGFRTTVEGNYFFGDNKTAVYNGGTIGCGGVRVYSKDHNIINNYFSGLTGSRLDAAITITNGDVDNNSLDNAAHYIPENVKVAYNTLVNNNSDIEIGYTGSGSYLLSPVNCSIANNIVIENNNPIVKSYSAASLSGVSFSNNIMYPTGTSTLGITASAAEINIVDPKLISPNCTAPVNCAQSNASRVLRLAAGSPAINAGTGTYTNVTLDYEQQPRTGANDIGADEYTSASPVTVLFTALDAANVGPGGIATPYTYILSGALPLNLLQFKAAKYNGAVRLIWATAQEQNEDRYDVEWSSNGSAFNYIGSVAARNSSNNENYQFDDTHNTGINYYRLKMVDKSGHYTYSPVCVVDLSGSISVYPNPVKDKLYIQLDGTQQNVQVNIIAADGRIVRSVSAKQAELIDIGMENVAAGIYSVQVSRAGAFLLNKRIAVIK